MKKKFLINDKILSQKKFLKFQKQHFTNFNSHLSKPKPLYEKVNNLIANLSYFFINNNVNKNSRFI